MATNSKNPISSAATMTKKKSPRKSPIAKKDIGDMAIVADKKEAAVSTKKSPSKRLAKSTSIHPVVRHHLIEVAAYYCSEKRGFSGGASHDDWLRAEQEIDALIVAGKFPT